uniref:Pre-C2HC domain-containing protein n=1 Tax=Clastoptera arizonana TaxID=38151 RepID=A0A1B6E0G7_9HEMI
MMSVNNTVTNTPNEYILSQQNQALFQENCQRSQNEQQLYIQWQYAVNGWQSANNEIIRLNSLMSDLQKQIDDLRINPSIGRPGTSIQVSTGSATPKSSRAGSPGPKKNGDTEYHTDEEELARETEWVRAKTKTKKRKLNTTPSPATPNNNKVNKFIVEKAKKEPLPPPIMVDDVKSYESLYQDMVSRIKDTVFQTKIINDKTIKINCINSEAYRAIIEILSSRGYSYHSYENKQTRLIRVMAKNLHHTCRPEGIIKELASKGYKINAAVNKLAWKNKTPLNMFMLFFENDENIEKIYGIKSILGCKVEIVPIKGTNLVPQCKRCQSYGHTIKYCCKQARCVKCAGKHLTEECRKSDKQEPKCVHCGENHPANYRGCVVAKEIQKIRNNKIQKNYNNKTINANNNNKNIGNKQTPAVQTENIKTKKPTYATILETNKEKGMDNKQNDNINQTLQLILNKITKLEKSVSNLNERVNKIESSIKKTTLNPKKT